VLALRLHPGPRLILHEEPVPAPGPGEVLLRVTAVGLCGSDRHWIVEGGIVTCPWHAWCFDVRTGRMTLGDFARLRRFELYVDDGAIFVAAEPEDES